jgi:hypothetical protein
VGLGAPGSCGVERPAKVGGKLTAAHNGAGALGPHHHRRPGREGGQPRSEQVPDPALHQIAGDCSADRLRDDDSGSGLTELTRARGENPEREGTRTPTDAVARNLPMLRGHTYPGSCGQHRLGSTWWTGNQADSR